MTELVKTYDAAEDKLNLTWDVQEYSLRQEGAINYQIVFKENIDDGENTAVFYTYKGIMINRGSIDADNHITANYPTILKQWIDRINELATEFGTPIHYIMFGESAPVSERMDGRLYFQYTNAENTIGHFEDHLGNVLSEFDKYITNCLIGAPHNVKVGLKDGVVTLEDGSKCYIPKSGGVFEEITISGNKTATITTDGTFFLTCSNDGSITWSNVITAGSGSSVPTDKSGLFYDTKNHTVGIYNNGTSTGAELSLPFAIVTVENGVCNSIVAFDRFGYIGSTVYALPGTDGVVPNGWNEDKSLKNTVWKQTVVFTRTFGESDNYENAAILFRKNEFGRVDYSDYKYDSERNLNLNKGEPYEFTLVGSCTLTNGVISNFKVKNQFREVDWNDFNDLIDRVLKLENSAVRLTGDQEVSGVKTFTDEIFAPNQLDYSRITNCLTHIPQDIKLELVDGTLTLKAGSKVYVPNGFEADGTTPKFDVIVINNDITHQQSANGEITVYYNFTENKVISFYSDADESGSTVPTYSKTFYNTSINKLSRYEGGATDDRVFSFPLARVTVSSGAISSIDQVFNGFGYIGSTVFALPGVKGLIPNGRNEDRTLRNVEFINNIVRTTTITTAGSYSVYLSGSNFYVSSVTAYDEDKNYNYGTANKDIRGVCRVGEVATDSSKQITSFTPKTTFQAADYQDVAKLNSDNTFNGDINIFNKVKVRGGYNSLVLDFDGSVDYQDIAFFNNGSRLGFIRCMENGMLDLNFTNGVALAPRGTTSTISSGYTTSRPGWLYVRATGNSRTSYCDITVGGKKNRVFDSSWSSSYGSPDSSFIPVLNSSKIEFGGLSSSVFFT